MRQKSNLRLAASVALLVPKHPKGKDLTSSPDTGYAKYLACEDVNARPYQCLTTHQIGTDRCHGEGEYEQSEEPTLFQHVYAKC